MTVRRRGRRIKLGANSYLNLNGNGQVTSQTTKAGSSTYTTFSKGGSRVTTNLGGGYFDVTDTRRGRPGRTRRRGGSDDGLALEVAIAVTVFLARSAWRLCAWATGVAWRSYQARREARRTALLVSPRRAPDLDGPGGSTTRFATSLRHRPKIDHFTGCQVVVWFLVS